MSKALALTIVFTFALSVACDRPISSFPTGQWIDLSHDFSDETIYWVTAEPFRRTTVAKGQTPGGYYYSAYNFSGA